MERFSPKSFGFISGSRLEPGLAPAAPRDPESERSGGGKWDGWISVWWRAWRKCLGRVSQNLEADKETACLSGDAHLNCSFIICVFAEEFLKRAIFWKTCCLNSSELGNNLVRQNFDRNEFYRAHCEDANIWVGWPVLFVIFQVFSQHERQIWLLALALALLQRSRPISVPWLYST